MRPLQVGRSGEVESYEAGRRAFYVIEFGVLWVVRHW